MPEFTHIEVESDSLPVVELDTEAQAAYVRFREGKVARTKRAETETVVVTALLVASIPQASLHFVALS
jgi:hypothetical protein